MYRFSKTYTCGYFWWQDLLYSIGVVDVNHKMISTWDCGKPGCHKCVFASETYFEP